MYNRIFKNLYIYLLLSTFVVIKKRMASAPVDEIITYISNRKWYYVKISSDL